MLEGDIMEADLDNELDNFNLVEALENEFESNLDGVSCVECCVFVWNVCEVCFVFFWHHLSICVPQIGRAHV